MKSKFLYALCVIPMMLLMTGCGDSISIPTGNGTVTVNSQDQSATIQTTNADGTSGTVTLSSEGKLPDGFPTDIPIPDGAKVTASMTSQDGMTVTLEVQKNFEETYTLYKDFLKSAGYTDVTETLIEDSFIGGGTKDGNQLFLTISTVTEAENTTSVAIVISKQQ